MSPCELVDLLNNIYSSFESIISSFDVTKIEVILDQYLVASGISLESYQDGERLGQSDKQVAEQQAHANPVAKEQKKRNKRKLANLRSATLIDESPVKVANDQEQSAEFQREQQEAELQLDHLRRTSAEQIARMALCIRDLVKSFHFRQNLSQTSGQPPEAPGQRELDEAGEALARSRGGGGGGVGGGFVAATFNIRIGIHSGKVCAGIVGLKRPKFCLIGDTVNVASRMHTNSKANRIQVSASTRDLLRQIPGFKLEPRGRIEIKGKGMMETFWLESSY